MKVDLFDFELPVERIALRPARPRDAARMLIVRESGPFEDRGVRDLPQMLRAGDVLVFNDTRVIPAQLEGRRGGAKIGATLHKRIDLRRWQAFVRNAKRLRPGDVAEFGGGVPEPLAAQAAPGLAGAAASPRACGPQEVPWLEARALGGTISSRTVLRGAWSSTMRRWPRA